MTEPKHSAKDKRRRRGRQENDNEKSKQKNEKSKPKNDKTPQHTTLLLQLTEDAPKWYLIGKQLPERNEILPKSDTKKQNTAVITQYRQQADALFRQEVALALSNKSKDDAWMESTMRKGTLKDRIAAMSVVLSQSPVHQFHVLQQLMDMARPNNNSRVAQLAAEALLDLWLHTYMPSTRPLISMAQRPLGRYQENANQTLSPRILLLWRFEEMIMEQYLTFLQQYLKHTLQEGLETQKIFALKSAATLLQRIPTGEQTVLSLLVNKLGDPARKIAARAAHELRGVLFHHPAMQPVVAREVQQTVHRPHLSPKALYHCILFLNQFEFSSRNPQSVALATSLIQTYFQLFEWAITGRSEEAKQQQQQKKKKAPDGKLNSRLLSALLTGVNRAHPYVDASHDMEQYLDALYRVVHTAPPAACTQAMLLLFHLVIGVEQKQLQQQEKKQRKVRNKTKDLVTPQTTTPEHEARRTRFYRALYAKLTDTQLLYSGKHLTQLFNLLYKSFKYDTNERRIQACCKRLVSTIMSCPNAATVTATLYLWHEVARIHPYLQQSYAQAVPEDSEYVLDSTKRDPRSALVLMQNGVVTAMTDSDDNGHVHAPVWEMALLQHHYHPSVVKFTQSLDSELAYNGDPLHDFAFGSFLDKFAYRNPKTSQRDKENARSVVMERHRSSTTMLPVNDRSFLQKNEVGPEDEFFFRFFEERAKRDQVKGIVRHKETKKGKKNDGDDDSQEVLDKIEQNNVDDDEYNDFDEYEQNWEDDPEEEAFVDSLAESLMEDTMDMPSDLDDEDPDTEGWDDLHDDDDDNNSVDSKDNDDDNGDDKVVMKASKADDDSSSSPADHDNDDDDDDAFMDQNDDSDSDGSDETPPQLVMEDDIMEDDDNDDDDQEKEDKHNDEDSVDEEEEDDDDAELLFMTGDTDDEDDDDDEEEEAVNFRSKKPKFETSVFASAEDYEERIEESFRELRRSIPLNSHAEDESMEEPMETQQKNKKKRKKNKKKH